MDAICDVCGKTYKVKAKQWRYSEKRGKKHCCSKQCCNKLQRTGKIVKCSCCGKEIYRAVKRLRDDNIYYCSIKCHHKCMNHSHPHSEETKKKISEKLKKHKVHKNKILQSKKIEKICPICNKSFKVFPYQKKRIYCSRQCYLKDTDLKFRKKTSGGLRQGSSRAYKGWYKGYWCDSSWELAFVIYNLEHGIKFERNKQGFEYEFQGEKHKFYPDFVLQDGTYVQIKGYMGQQNKTKIASFGGTLQVLGKVEISPYLEYTENKYGKNYIKLYEIGV